MNTVADRVLEWLEAWPRGYPVRTTMVWQALHKPGDNAPSRSGVGQALKRLEAAGKVTRQRRYDQDEHEISSWWRLRG